MVHASKKNNVLVPRSDICGLAVVGMHLCGHALYGFGGVLMFEYDTKGAILNIGMRPAYGKRTGSVFLVSHPRTECAGRTQGSAETNSQVMLARPASDPFLAGHDLT